MSDAQKKALRNYRARLHSKGLARVEVQVPKGDVALVRDLAKALTDPAREHKVRAALKSRVSPYAGMGLKELLAAAPLEGVDLTRDRDTGRDVDL